MTKATRILRFATVGTICFIVQWCALLALQNVMHTLQASTVAFIVSAQLNFILSSVVTWRDKKIRQGRTLRWAKFNTSVLLAVCINTAVMWICVELGIWLWLALIIANFTSTVFTFIVNDNIVYRMVRDEQTEELGIFRASLQRGL